MLIEKHDKRSFIFGVPGVLLFIGGMFFATTDPIPFIGVMIFLISVPFFFDWDGILCSFERTQFTVWRLRDFRTSRFDCSVMS